MIWYELHIGDWMRRYGHLDATEDGVLRRLVDRYFSDERPLPKSARDLHRLARASCAKERAAVRTVCELMTEREDGLHLDWVDEQISFYRDKSAKARKSAGARWGRRDSAGDDPPPGPLGGPGGRPDGRSVGNATAGASIGASAYASADASADANALLEEMRSDPERICVRDATRARTDNRQPTEGGATTPARDARAQDLPPPGGGHRDQLPRPSDAARACLAMRGANIHDVNPQHPELLELLAAGATPELFGSTAAECVARGKASAAYVIAVVRGRMRDAAARQAAPPTPAGRPQPGTTVPGESTADYLARRAAEDRRRAAEAAAAATPEETERRNRARAALAELSRNMRHQA